jgi:hypothetical protein
MERSGAMWSLTDALAPLESAFGDRLTLCRNGNVVEWSFEGQSAVVELHADATLGATFIDRPAFEAVSRSFAAPVYHRTSAIEYRMTPEGCTRMVDDLLAFFSGTREPLFRFAAAVDLPTAG